MTFPIILKTEAECDLAEAKAWYDEQRPGLGEEFLDEVDNALKLLSENPYLAAIAYSDIRRALTKRFPYGVFYLLENDSIIILAVLHAKRDPAHWRQRR